MLTTFATTYRSIAVRSLWVLVVSAATVTAQAQSPRFEHLNYENDLPAAAVWTMAQDAEGYVWLGTGAGLGRYNNFEVELVQPDIEGLDFSKTLVRALHFDDAGNFWIGTQKRGLIQRDSSGHWRQFLHDEHNTESITANRILDITSDRSGNIWIGTDRGLNKLDANTLRIVRYSSSSTENATGQLPSNTIRTLKSSSYDGIWIGTYQGLASINPTSNVIRTVDLKQADLKIVDIHEDASGQLWLGTATGLFLYDPKTNQTSQPIEELKSRTVPIISENSKGLWFGTLGSGVFHRSNDGKIHHYQSNGSRYSLADNSVVSMLSDHAGNVWLGTFHNGVSTLNLQTLAFGRVDGSGKNFSCLDSNTITGFLTEPSNTLWVGTSDGLAQVDRATGNCNWLPARSNSQLQLPRTILDIIRASDGNLYLAGAPGIGRIIGDQLQPELLPNTNVGGTAYFISERAPTDFLFGTNTGLYSYNPETNQSTAISTALEALSIAIINNYAQDSKGRYWFATSLGIAYLDDNDLLKILRRNGAPAHDKTVTNIMIDHNDALWIASENDALMKYSTSGELLYSSTNNPLIPRGVMSIETDKQHNIWVSTRNGIAKIDSETSEVTHFDAANGLQGREFTRLASHVAANGEMFFGGRLGFNNFFPQDIRIDTVPPDAVLAELRIHNKIVSNGISNHGFLLSQPLNSIGELEFSHKHKMFSLVFAALHTGNSRDTKFSYRLDGFDTEWNQIEAPERSATYTNLKPGNYVFRLRAANRDENWSATEKTINIIVSPAPWATWWAKLIYILATGFLAIWIVGRRFAAQRKYSAELQSEVQMRTREVEDQKNTIERILERKNALFENISHEFKTPLTLLIGPLEQLRKQLDVETQTKKVDLAVRNAKRLLTMVDQLLQLSDVTQSSKPEKSLRDIAPSLKMLAASFAPSAKLRDISLTVGECPDVTVEVTTDAIEIIVGNLLSNAIKYSASNSSIDLSCTFATETVTIVVSDNGSGIKADKLETIFERFSRLPEHADLPGTGLGLAVVKEVVEANGGSISVESTLGTGTTFTVTLPAVPTQSTSDYTPWNQPPSVTQDLAALAETKSEPNQIRDGNSELEYLASNTNDDNNQPLILTIDDNRDILEYIQSVLSENFRFVGANSGAEGIRIAEEIMPDLIICDVMMPAMDGFEVSEALRNSDITSHIPIVLLTAKGDQSSRLKGWDAAVDDYIQKPFNEVELVSRLNNLLLIRQLLSEKRAEHLEKGTLNTESKGLNDRDKNFLDNVTAVVDKHFTDSRFDRAKLATAVNVSERQLQRKLKALINCNPADFVKNHRLDKAANMIAEGGQISIVAHECGFSSGSYFTKCFRQKFNEAPKQYQLRVSSGKQSQ